MASLEEWQEILRIFKNGHGRCESNCYLSADRLSEYIAEQRMNYEICDNTLWLIEREKDYDIAYYNTAKTLPITSCRKVKKPRIVYLIGSEQNYKAQGREKELIQSGFQSYRKNLEYKVLIEERDNLKLQDKRCDRYLKKFGLHYEWFQKKNYDEIYKLWKRRIDLYSVKYALPSQIDRMEKRNECILLCSEEGGLVGACNFEINGESAFSENIAVSERWNGTGIGAAMIVHSFLHIVTSGANDSTYVWEGNMESRRVCERFAALSGRFSKQLILKETGE